MRTNAEGRFEPSIAHPHGGDTHLYLVAQSGTPTANKAGGANPAIALVTVLGNKPLAKGTINEMTTVASVWTHDQFIDGTAIKGQPVQLKIAEGNVPSFVDLATGGWGTTIQDRSTAVRRPSWPTSPPCLMRWPLAGCVTQVKTDACTALY